jgi:hypothetical protein
MAIHPLCLSFLCQRCGEQIEFSRQRLHVGDCFTDLRIARQKFSVVATDAVDVLARLTDLPKEPEGGDPIPSATQRTVLIGVALADLTDVSSRQTLWGQGLG